MDPYTEHRKTLKTLVAMPLVNDHGEYQIASLRDTDISNPSNAKAILLNFGVATDAPSGLAWVYIDDLFVGNYTYPVDNGNWFVADYGPDGLIDASDPAEALRRILEETSDIVWTGTPLLPKDST